MKDDYIYEGDRLKLEREFDELFLRINQMPEAERYVRGLELVEKFWTDNAHRDRDGWLRRAVLTSKAHLFDDMERPGEAVKVCEQLAQFGLRTHWERIHLAWFWGMCLLQLSRYEQAFHILERGLDLVPDECPNDAFDLLYGIGVACHALERPVPPRHMPTFLAGMAAHGLPVTDELRAELKASPERLGQTVVHAYESMLDEVRRQRENGPIETRCR